MDVECVIARFVSGDFHVPVGAFYRSPSSTTVFFEKLNEFLCEHRNSRGNLFLVRDFNVPDVSWVDELPNALSTSAEPFADILLLHSLTQLAPQPTCIEANSGSILGLFLGNSGLLGQKPTVHLFERILDHKMACLTIPDIVAPEKKKH